MFKGRLILKMAGDLKEKQSIHFMELSMLPPIIAFSDKFDFDYKRFEFLTADLIWVIEFTVFTSIRRLYNTFRESTFKHFSNWQLEITLLINETGD